LDKKTEEELIWNYDTKPVWEGKQFMHGHATVKDPTTTNKGTNINTLCGYGGILTGMLIDMSCFPTIDKLTLGQHNLISFSISEGGILIE